MVSEDEVKLWRIATRDVTPLAGRPAEEVPPDPPAQPVAEPASAKVPAVPRQPAAPPRSAVAPRLDHGQSPGVDKRTAERLRKGEMAIDGVLDLHGLTQDAAHAALYRFLSSSSELGRRCLLVITGKGSREGAGVLRSQVPRWLNESGLRPFLLAFAYAQPKHGGEGAVYVLLKRRR